MEQLHTSLKTQSSTFSEYVKVTQETSVLFFQYENKIWLCRINPDPLPTYLTWNKLAKYLVSILHQTPPPQNLQSVLIEALFPHRRKAHTWLLTHCWIPQAPHRPPLPVDCITPTKYLLTLSGCIPWHPLLKLPHSLDYKAYLTILGKFIAASQASSDTMLSQEDTEDLLKLLLLL